MKEPGSQRVGPGPLSAGRQPTYRVTLTGPSQEIEAYLGKNPGAILDWWMKMDSDFTKKQRPTRSFQRIGEEARNGKVRVSTRWTRVLEVC